MNQSASLHALLNTAPANTGALGAPGEAWRRQAELVAFMERSGQQLAGARIGRNGRVAIVLPNGLLMAMTFLAVGAYATTAPLNPAYTPAEFAFYLKDLNAGALIVLADRETPARAVAKELNIPVLEVRGDGTWSDDISPAPLPEPAQPDDIALVLHTSGTTARPKIVPLTQTNILSSAGNIARTLELTPADVCLNIMPLFHIHGLIAALLASLVAGGSVACASGASGPAFFEWMREVRPTWYTAVPSMHQGLLKLAPRYRETIAEGRLRFIRSSSASLPPTVMGELEEAFGVPVIEAYGMTEAAHQMTSNRLPPGKRIAGSVGGAAGPDVAVMDGAGNILPPGSAGEVVIRGDNVMHGYENQEANVTAFTSGWFRTGDEGVLDDAGTLRLTGRIKEQINRGGEKISPLEVDNVLMEHPAVQQAVTFSLPDKDYGESVAAALVLHKDAPADARAIRAFAAERLAAFKVPAKLIFVDEIPKGPTGKLQRIGLAAKLGLN